MDAVIFDKTGTLTRGEPFVTAARSCSDRYGDQEVLRLAACAEANLKHPATKAIVDAARNRELVLSNPDDMEYILGLGVRARVEGRDVCVGSPALHGPPRSGAPRGGGGGRADLVQPR